MTETLSIRLDAETKRRLEKIARRSRRSTSLLATEAITAFVREEEGTLAEMEAGLRELDAGQGVPHERVAAWLATWGNGKRVGRFQ